MEKYAILLGYFDKQMKIITRLQGEIEKIDVAKFEPRYVFSLKTQQFYTALEDLFKQIAKTFENHIENLSSYHKELLMRMSMEIPGMRPAILSDQSVAVLDKVRSFRHFIRHAYDCELDPDELREIQKKLREDYSLVRNDLAKFREYLLELTV